MDEFEEIKEYESLAKLRRYFITRVKLKNGLYRGYIITWDKTLLN